MLAFRIFCTPGNSVLSERAFLTQNFIHTKSRNRLKADHVNKLNYIYMNSHVLWQRFVKELEVDIARKKVMTQIFTIEEELEQEDRFLQEEEMQESEDEEALSD